MARRACPRSPPGSGAPRERRSSAAIRMPGVQKPHWSAWWRLKASWSGESAASPASDSTVSTAEPSACTASRQQARTETPSSRTVHAPQTPCSQPTWVPVRPRRWRRKSVSSSRGSTCSATTRPFTVSVISVMRLAPRRGSAPARRASRSARAGTAAEAWIEAGGSTACGRESARLPCRRRRHGGAVDRALDLVRAPWVGR